jgi:hypothetical protein
MPRYTKEQMLELMGHIAGFEERLFEMQDGAVSFEMAEDDDDNERLIMRLGAERFSVSKDAYVEANKIIGLGGGYVERTPVDYVVPHLNYWFDEMGEERKAIIKDGEVVTYSRPGTELYDLVEFVQTLCNAIEERGYTEYYFEKVFHDVGITLFSVVIPDLSRQIGEDTVEAGIHVQHSFLGKKPTILTAYTHQDVAGFEGGTLSATYTNKWNRKLGQWRAPNEDIFDTEEVEVPDDVYNVYRWLESGVGEIIVRAGREFDTIEQLQNYQIGGHGGTFLNDVFTKYKIPNPLQKAIREEYGMAERQTMYDLYKAVIATSGRAEVAEKPTQMHSIMEVAGEIAAHPGKCDGCHRMI